MHRKRHKRSELLARVRFAKQGAGGQQNGAGPTRGQTGAHWSRRGAGAGNSSSKRAAHKHSAGQSFAGRAREQGGKKIGMYSAACCYMRRGGHAAEPRSLQLRGAAGVTGEPRKWLGRGGWPAYATGCGCCGGGVCPAAWSRLAAMPLAGCTLGNSARTGSSSELDRMQRAVLCRSMASLQRSSATRVVESRRHQAQQPSRLREGHCCVPHAQGYRRILPGNTSSPHAEPGRRWLRRRRGRWQRQQPAHAGAHSMRWKRLELAENSCSLRSLPR